MDRDCTGTTTNTKQLVDNEGKEFHFRNLAHVQERLKGTNIKHNKKRNVGLIYELLLRHLSSRIIVNDKKGAKIATAILEKHFSKGSELYKEFRLFNALAKSLNTFKKEY